jgi:hypothetical protein
MDANLSWLWVFAVGGGTLLLALALWFGASHTRDNRRSGATAPRSYDEPGKREALQGRNPGGDPRP